MHKGALARFVRTTMSRQKTLAFWNNILFLRLDSHKLVRTVAVRLLTINTDEFDWTVGQRIIDRTEGELPAANVAVNCEVPLVRNPFQHHSVHDLTKLIVQLTSLHENLNPYLKAGTPSTTS